LKSRKTLAAWARAIWFGLGAVLAIAPSAPASEEPVPAAATPTAAGKLLMISDLHFAPMADPRLVDRLASVEIENWRALPESSGETSFGRYGADASWLLLRSALHR
jgi:hypothetical protein